MFNVRERAAYEYHCLHNSLLFISVFCSTFFFLVFFIIFLLYFIFTSPTSSSPISFKSKPRAILSPAHTYYFCVFSRLFVRSLFLLYFIMFFSIIKTLDNTPHLSDNFSRVESVARAQQRERCFRMNISSSTIFMNEWTSKSCGGGAILYFNFPFECMSSSCSCKHKKCFSALLLLCWSAGVSIDGGRCPFGPFLRSHTSICGLSLISLEWVIIIDEPGSWC